ncbi:hypothetical protein ACLX1H_010238 [Fusarium chlamydosporum]
MKSSITLSLVALAPYMAQAAKSTTQYSTSTVFIPPMKTGTATEIYASMITSDSSSTKYLLGCQSDLDASTYSCDNDFDHITYTQYPNKVQVEFAVTSFGCATYDNLAICASQTGSETAATRTLQSSERDLWMTAITFVDVKKRKTTATHASSTAQAAETGSPKLCKRKVHDHVSGGSGSDAGSGSSSGGTMAGDNDSDADSDSDSGSTVSKKPKDNDDCSAASFASVSWAVVAMGLGGYLGLNL